MLGELEPRRQAEVKSQAAVNFTLKEPKTERDPRQKIFRRKEKTISQKSKEGQLPEEFLQELGKCVRTQERRRRGGAISTRKSGAYKRGKAVGWPLRFSG